MPKKAIHLIIFDIIASFGSQIFSFACSFFILKHTDNTAFFSIYLAVVTLSTIISAPLFGTFTDTMNNKRLITAAQIVNIVSLVLFVFIYHSFFYYILILGIILNLTDGAISNIISANMQQIAEDSIERFILLFQGIGKGISIIAPIFGGVLISFVSIEKLALFNVLTELTAIVIIYFIPLKATLSRNEQNFWFDFKEGFHYLLNKRFILSVILFVTLFNFLANCIAVGMPIISIQSLKLSAPQFGFVESSFTLAMMLMMIVLSVFPIKQALKGSMQISLSIAALTIIGLGLYLLNIQSNTFSFIVILALMTLVGISLPIFNVPTMIFMQKAIDDQFKGRVFGLCNAISQAMTPLSFVFFGMVLNNHQGWVFLITGSVFLLAILLFSLFIKKEQFNVA
ncbi:MFS transporter [Staphylococcus simulans]|uniref:MFS transporter n=1 Tax=Staphylococcus simulans TaxID=1286 RepID=UPI001E471455|nr:MFS transporter [Staphylococcus simulans]MCD8914313.1 MFS transporter [Staphylococcus simulans]